MYIRTVDKEWYVHQLCGSAFCSWGNKIEQWLQIIHDMSNIMVESVPAYPGSSGFSDVN
jgi:hypothetical protein